MTLFVAIDDSYRTFKSVISVRVYCKSHIYMYIYTYMYNEVLILTKYRGKICS